MGGMQRLAAYIRYLSLVALAAIAAGCASVPAWQDCSRASCWQGSNASTRHMNILSPHFADAVFQDRVKWAKARGCNTVHLFLVNQHDGEGSGYSALDPATAKVMDKRIKWVRSQGMAVVLWCMADDSSAWAKSLDMEALMKVCESHGWLGLASTIVVGLEVDEYWSSSQVAAHIATIRRHYKGKVGVHMTSGKTSYAGLADILFYQVSPGKSASQIASETKRALACGKPVNFFELDRHENRSLSEAALAAGAFGVGNW